ncbi:hypothetical protein MNBD_GAMMA17-1934 [hydrothermal vent metagenome]|uniref:Uncharacterized protein n=1 Tax=hydrothermal vent metagenome TaxID=652676 RepID=A0A3B1A2L0_9ZZZZ
MFPTCVGMNRQAGISRPAGICVEEGAPSLVEKKRSQYLSAIEKAEMLDEAQLRVLKKRVLLLTDDKELMGFLDQLDSSYRLERIEIRQNTGK